jgi:hypothetical protein
MRLPNSLNQNRNLTPRKALKPCLFVVTKEGFWTRFHQLRSEGLDKNDAFRIVSQEVIETSLSVYTLSPAEFKLMLESHGVRIEKIVGKLFTIPLGFSGQKIIVED